MSTNISCSAVNMLILQRQFFILFFEFKSSSDFELSVLELSKEIFSSEASK